MICLTAMGGQYGCCLLPETCDPALNRYHLGHKERGWLPRVVTRDQTQPSDGGALIPTTAGNTQIWAAERGRARAHGPGPCRVHTGRQCADHTSHQIQDWFSRSLFKSTHVQTPGGASLALNSPPFRLPESAKPSEPSSASQNLAPLAGSAAAPTLIWVHLIAHLRLFRCVKFIGRVCRGRRALGTLILTTGGVSKAVGTEALQMEPWAPSPPSAPRPGCLPARPVSSPLRG